MPNAVVIGDEKCYTRVADALKSLPVKVFAGKDAIAQIVEMDTIDLVLNALVGYSGLKPAYRAVSGRQGCGPGKQGITGYCR